jgi:hypothetical protein
MPTPDGPQFRVYHGTNLPSDEVMKAPSIHAGTEDAAYARLHDLGYTSYHQATLELTPSEHLEKHPVMLRDDEANAADARYLKKSNYPVPRSIEQSATSSDDMDYKTARRIVGASRALARNHMVMYQNDFESGLSVIIPSPHHNAALTNVTSSDKLVSGKTVKGTRNKTKDPHKQTPLPMNYSTLQVSNRTKTHREGIDEDDA